MVGHTKGGKIVAAIDNKRYPWMGDVYQLILKEPNLFTPKMDLKDVVEILNSKLMNEYVSVLYKNITPHTTATQLKLIPLHTKKYWVELERKYEKDRKN